VRASIDRVEAESRNVVGRSGDVCRFYIGAHYDSVPAGPGANDNASGTALILELARTHRIEGLCVIAFGAEEIGFFGSQDYVATSDLSEARFILNFDMAGLLEDALIIGDAALTSVLVTSLEGLPIRAGEFPAFASSDHVTFLDAGVPAVTITSGDNPQIHTSRDDINNVSRASLTTMLEITTVSLTTALTGAG
jgi:Zn-dependent M28 family amino/carboxypeptidase